MSEIETIYDNLYERLVSMSEYDNDDTILVRLRRDVFKTHSHYWSLLFHCSGYKPGSIRLYPSEYTFVFTKLYEEFVEYE